MKLKASLAVCSVALLAACGGGSSGTSNNPTLSLSTVRVFSDNAGVARGTDNAGNTIVLLAPDIAATVSAANSPSQQSITDAEVSDFPIVQVLNTSANLRRGAMTVDGVAVNVDVIEDLGGEAAVIIYDIPGYANAVMTFGTPNGSVPSGTYQYTGTLGTGVRSTNPQIEFGSFTLNANFTNQSFSITGSTLSDTLSGNGLIDNSAGTLSSSNITMVTSGTNRTATLYGNFHGTSAQSVSGAFHTNEQNPVFAGAFVGSR